MQLVFPVPIRVQTVRLYGPEAGGVPQSTLEITDSVVRLLDDVNGSERASRAVHNVRSSGTDVTFDGVVARVVRIEFNQLRGRFYGANVAALTEVEVIARGETATTSGR